MTEDACDDCEYGDRLCPECRQCPECCTTPDECRAYATARRDYPDSTRL